MWGDASLKDFFSLSTNWHTIIFSTAKANCQEWPQHSNSSFTNPSIYSTQHSTLWFDALLVNIGFPLRWLAIIRVITVRVFPSPISSARIPPLGESGFLSVEILVLLLIQVDSLTCVQNGAKSVLFSLIIIQLRACSWWGNSCVVMACNIQIKNVLNVIGN